MENIISHKIYKINDLVDFKDDCINAKVISKNGDFASLLVAIKKGQTFKEHVSPVNAFVYVLDGSVDFKINDGQITTYNLEKGDVFTFLANEKHSLEGIKDSKILVVRI